MTQRERKKLHTALFSRVLREVNEGSLKDAQIGVEMLGNVDSETDSSEVLAALLGDNGIPDETRDGTRICGPDTSQ